MVIYRLGLPYYKEFDNFQFISLLLYYTRYAPLLPPGWLP